MSETKAVIISDWIDLLIFFLEKSYFKSIIYTLQTIAANFFAFALMDLVVLHKPKKEYIIGNECFVLALIVWKI